MRKEYIRTKEGSNISKIIVDRDLCIGAASCVAVSAATYKLDDENKAVVIDPNAASDEELITAAKSCPTKAIIIIDKEEKQIYP
ncbi:hypothetical protein A2819_02510 [Candidatus Azambacteria bacterium RIFCSPHIGHO2_01_FULL_40_24]|uniref:Ferredoxin n=1 Tax=Candidatus Azambacteria bacterium RIFCSPHIGHO2_01_FULL_40_24 TaxID=1797301 RepID=A0A1F5B3L4_9BACT|nr:MAG: hypothetical protein A2819_02510 [Candidatus Azambacteria bacterium RIFCSPHIGHO2_01_FULL_40_24]